jgi:elongation factor G
MPPANCTPPCIIFVKVEPKTKAGEPALRDALQELVQVDPNLSFTVDAESAETIIHGWSELHLDAAVGHLLQRGVGVNVGAPQVAYRETLACPTEADYTHKRLVGGSRQFARVKLRLEPNENGKGNVFEVSMVGDLLPKEYHPAVEKGVRSVWENGVLIGSPIADMKVTLYDIALHESDSSATAFEIATRAAMKQGCDKGGIKILEPIMDVEVVTPGDFVGAIIGDLNAIRAYIRTIEMRDDALTMIRANVPLVSLFGYVSRLRSLSDGRASHDMSFSHYQEVPQFVGPDPNSFPPAGGIRARLPQPIIDADFGRRRARLFDR